MAVADIILDTFLSVGLFLVVLGISVNKSERRITSGEFRSSDVASVVRRVQRP